MAVILALGSALAYGLSDFVGGLVSRRASAWPVAVLAQTSSTVCVTGVALVAGGTPGLDHLAWAVLAGVGGGTGAGFLYRGLAAGRMSVVAPVSAVAAALVPVLAGTLGGERPAVLVWAGLALALPGIWLVAAVPAAPSAGPPDHPPGSHPPGSHPPGSHPPGSHAPGSQAPGSQAPGSHAPVSHAPVSHPVGSHPMAARPSGIQARRGQSRRERRTLPAEGVGDGLLAGLGFGLLFACLGQVPDTAGWWPLALCQLVSVAAVVSLAAALRAPWLPRGAAVRPAVLAGPLGAAATGLFLLATQSGYLTVAGVLASLYPAGTVLLAAVVLRERVHRAQGLGLALCAVAVMLVAGG